MLSRLVWSGTALADPIPERKLTWARLFMNTNEASLEAPQNGALWVVQTLGATLFLISGLAKLSGDDQTLP
jgi:hypothetical protein